jgi:hypothetical protein
MRQVAVPAALPHSTSSWLSPTCTHATGDTAAGGQNEWRAAYERCRRTAWCVQQLCWCGGSTQPRTMSNLPGWMLQVCSKHQQQQQQ